MTARRTSLRNGLALAICGIVFIGFTAHAQLDADSDLGGTPADSGASNAPAAKSAAAAKKPAGNGKRTSIDFEDELIEGQTQKPELFYLLQKRQFNYKRMIRLRENFLPEMRKTAEEIQRKGSGD